MTNTDDINVRVGREVNAWIARRGILKQDVAALIGTDPSGISRRITGRVPFALDELEVLAQAFEIRLPVLLGEPPTVTELRASPTMPGPPATPAVRGRRGRKIAERRPTIPKVIICQPNRVRPVTSRYHRVHLLTSGEATHTHRAA
jgi:hypothetical protein